MLEELFASVSQGTDDVLVRLLRAGVSAESADEDGSSALYVAAVSDRPTTVRLLLAAGADPGRASGPEGGDLPLCGAASGGHTEVVRALLAAGADPDLHEAYGFTAVAWAAVQGFADTLEVLLGHGADPDLPGPGGERPLVLAARRGSPGAVRVLLGHGAGLGDPGAREAALAEAGRWMGGDVEGGLREGLLRAYGGGYETVVRRVVADGGETVTVELLRDGVPVAGQSRETGHAAVVTVLEGDLALPVSYEELAGRALRCGDPDRDDWRESVRALAGLQAEETFQLVSAWCADGDAMRQAFAVDVLAEAAADGLAGRAVPLLRELSRRAERPELVRSVVRALGRFRLDEAVPEIVRHLGHPDGEVRRRVATALGGRPAGVAALVALSGDAEARVRERAVAALSAPGAGHGPEVRETLAARLSDADATTAARAAAGLAARGDPRALGALERILAEADPEGPARRIAAAGVELLPEGAARRRLERVPPRRRGG